MVKNFEIGTFCVKNYLSKFNFKKCTYGGEYG